jgi:hypothetical protein
MSSVRPLRSLLPTPTRAELRHRADLYRRLAAATADQEKSERLKELALRWDAEAEATAED